MRKGVLHIIISSLVYYKKSVLNQIIIIAILAAVITGSLLTGYSVRKSLKDTAFSRMGNTSVLVSSGLRYFDSALADRLSQNLGEKIAALTELDGFCQNFNDGTISKKVKIYGVSSDFFRFNGNDSITLKKGEVAINNNLARQINIKPGDEIIIRVKAISDIPADAPFSTDDDGGRSIVMKVIKILETEEAGDFSLGISQIVPTNIFINPEDLENFSYNKNIKPNRLIIRNIENKTLDFFDTILRKTITLPDLGLKLRKVEVTGENELVSDRIFIDQIIVDDIKKLLPSAASIITYLANSITSNGGVTPYSFITALPAGLYNVPEDKKNIIINIWLARDLKAFQGDTIKLSWFTPDSINQLKENSTYFTVSKVVEMDSIWGDRSLMPEFPGISGSESCSDWDAGVPVDTKKIRDKDEDYWDKFKGTPKAFISYETGKELWGSNFGPATAIRFPAALSSYEIEDKLSGSFDPARSGLLITALRSDALKAANGGVDFGTLFISLGFFIILSAILLLSLSVSSYFNTKKNQVATYFSLGFTNKFIRRFLFLETVLIAVIGAFAGSLLGLLVNNYIIKALNTVWQGAVQTDTLTASAGVTPLILGFISTLVLILIFFQLKTRYFINSLSRKKDGILILPSKRMNLYFLIAAAFILIVVFSASLLLNDLSMPLSFASGTLLFITFILLLRHYYLGGIRLSRGGHDFSDLARMYYRHNPSNAIAPVIFIAAGIFALFITSLNRMDFDKTANDPKGGTGGYLFWAETNVPVTDDLSSSSGIVNFGLDEDPFKEMEFMQISRKEGDDASCLNLNHVSAPPLLGIDPAHFIEKEAFSFATVIKSYTGKNPWETLLTKERNNTIYGIADQTVLQWGLKIKTGDTLIIRAETGQPVNIIIAGGLKSSVFQGNVLIDKASLRKYFPSVSGSSIFLIDGDTDRTDEYKSALAERFAGYGINVESSSVRLASFYQVTNTYLSVFTVLGAFGMILGIFGLGFIMFRNYNLRKQEFALLSATGFSLRKIRKSLLADLMIILFAGILTGILSALLATIPSIQNSTDLTWKTLIIMILSILLTGITVLLISVRSVKNESLISGLRKE